MYLNRVRFMRDKASDRLLTCTADIIHTADLTGDLKITNCVLEGSHGKIYKYQGESYVRLPSFLDIDEKESQDVVINV